MGDLQFAKQFLTSIDNKTTKYQSDHVFDPKTYQMRIPYTLPKLSNPPHPLPPKTKPAPPPAPGSESARPTVSVTLKSARNPNMTVTLPSVDPGTTTIQGLKEQVQACLGGPGVVQVDKIKLLQNKKPIPPSKRLLTDAVEERDLRGHLELGVMVMGGAPDPTPDQVAAAVAAVTTSSTGGTTGASVQDTPMEGVESTATANTQSTSGAGPEPGVPVRPGEASAESVLQTTEFWDDLQGFLEQRIRNQSDAERLRSVFESAWKSHSSRP
ncbi:uncharacterized protein PV06_06358 [Exophiala oligosperma]|uniref:Ubiquitin-like domain-containing protein n=2 Tax=Chaetothyriales TaxID=34395 RepID=A0A0D2DK98_9EURO|nr:uncharacterized protein PV06_06358 [Exophiala oligosperma]KAJ9644427.1 hypothetical protein H2204_001779 [Knufia peltigerae]KIW42850.1 hypothetical protein PV06_06358 [Exophiala oligosperma]